MRKISKDWTSETKREFVSIAMRCQDEACALYTYVALGLVRYYRVSTWTLADLSK